MAVAQAPVLGLARTIALEHPELRARCVDLDPADGAGDRRSAGAELLAGRTRARSRTGAAMRQAARLARFAADHRAPSRPSGAAASSTRSPGILDGLELRPLDAASTRPRRGRDRGPGDRPELPGRAERARHVPRRPGAARRRVRGRRPAVGAASQGLAPGDAVVALARRAASRRHVTTRADLGGAQAARLDVRARRPRCRSPSSRPTTACARLATCAPASAC